MTVLNKWRALQRGLLVVILLVCLSVVLWSFSTEEDGSQREQKTSGHISAGGVDLTKQQKPKHAARTSGDKPNNM